MEFVIAVDQLFLLSKIKTQYFNIKKSTKFRRKKKHTQTKMSLGLDEKKIKGSNHPWMYDN